MWRLSADQASRVARRYLGLPAGLGTAREAATLDETNARPQDSTMRRWPKAYKRFVERFITSALATSKARTIKKGARAHPNPIPGTV